MGSRATPGAAPLAWAEPCPPSPGPGLLRHPGQDAGLVTAQGARGGAGPPQPRGAPAPLPWPARVWAPRSCPSPGGASGSARGAAGGRTASAPGRVVQPRGSGARKASRAHKQSHVGLAGAGPGAGGSSGNKAQRPGPDKYWAPRGAALPSAPQVPAPRRFRVAAMPFLGQDWRSPGQSWVKTADGWKRFLDERSGGFVSDLSR